MGRRQKYPAVEIGNCRSVTMSVGQNGLTVSADVYSPEGTRLGTIVDNGYEIGSGNDLVVERSGDLSTLIVHDSARRELLWVKYLNPKAILIRGVFSCPSPRLLTVTATDNGLVTPGSHTWNGGCIVSATGGGFLIR